MKFAVVGAGLLGRLLTYRLAAIADSTVTLFHDTSLTEEAGASWAAGGMLAPYTEATESDPEILRVGEDALDRWRSLSLELGTDLYDHGSLIVAHSRDEGLLRQFCQRFSRHGHKGEEVFGSKLGELEPLLSNSVNHGFYVGSEGHVNPPQILRALGSSIRARGVTLIEGTAVNPMPFAIEGETGSSRYDLVFDCRGIKARDDWTELRSVRGEAILLACPRLRCNRPIRLLHPRYAMYLIPRSEATFYLGATAIETDNPGPITVQSALELLSSVYSLHPAFKDAAVLRSVVGLRPVLPHGLPEIRKSPGLWRINGLSRHGYLLAPWLVDSVISELRGQPFKKPGNLGFPESEALECGR